MKASKYLKLMFALVLLTLCLPWFTYNAKVMGYRYGFVFLKWFLVPAGALAVCLFWPKRKLPLVIVGELALLGNFGALVCALGLWQQVCNIKSGFQWMVGIRTAQPGYWVAVCIFILFFGCFQIELINGTAKSVK